MMVMATMAWAIDVSTAQALKEALRGTNTDVRLTADIEVSETLVLTGAHDVKLDLAGHTLVGNGCRALWVKNGSLTISSTENGGTVSTIGTIDSNSSVIHLGDTDTEGESRNVALTVEKNVTVSTDKCYGITVFGSKTSEKLVVKGKVTTTDLPAISGNGNAENAGTTILIDDDAEIKTTNEVAIYHPQSGQLTVKGTVTGAGGIEIKAGQLIVTDNAKITATGAVTHTENNDGTSTRGYAIAIVENKEYAGVSAINISKDATIVGPVAMVKDSENNTTAHATFAGDGLQMLVKVTDSEGKSFGQYRSLELAMADAPAGCTVTLLDNVEIASTIETNQDFTLDLNGHTLTSNGQRALWIKSGNVDIKSTATGGEMVVPTLSNPDHSVIRVGSDESAAVSLTVAENVTISADECYGITVFGKNSTETLTVNGNIKTKIRSAISGNGTAGLASTTVTIGQTANITTTNDVAIYQPQAGTLSVNGNVTGEGGIEIKGGSLEVGSSAKVTATGTPKHEANGDGTSTRGYAIAIVETSAGYGNNYGVSAVSVDNSAQITGPVAQLQDSPKAGGFSPTYTGNAVSQKVAAIGKDEYFTLKDAVDIVPSEGKVMLLHDLTLSQTLVMDKLKTYTLDLAGKTLTGNACAAIQLTGGHVTIDGMTGSKVTVSGSAPSAAILMGDDSGNSRNITLTINKDVTVDGSTLASGIKLAGSITRETLTVHGTVTANGHSAIVGSNDPAHGGTTITIATDGTVQSTDTVALYHPQSGELVVEGTIKGLASTTEKTAGAIEMKGGDLTVKSTAKISAVGSTSHSANADAPSTNGYAIALVENANFTGVGKANISDQATITGIIACLIDSKNNNVAEPIFSGDVTMVAETHILDGRGDKYAKLTDAIAEATESGEVKLLDDLSVTKTLDISKAITLNLDDYSLLGKQSSSATMTISANVTVTLKNGGITSDKDGIAITSGTVNLQQMTVNAKGVSLNISGGSVTADQTTSLTSTESNTIALSGGTLELSGKVYNTSSTSNNNAIASTSGGLTVKTTAIISSANGNGIDWKSAGTLTINGGKIMGNNAVYADKGNVTIDGGVFTGTQNGLEIASGSTPAVNGGTFYCGANTSDKPITATSATGFVKGDYFSKPIAQTLCADGYMVSANPKNNGLYYLVSEIVINDGTQWVVPAESFKIATAKYIRNSGMGAHGTKFGTLCLPFSIDPTATQCIPTGMTFYEVESINAEKSEITITQLTSVIDAGTPVVFEFADNTTNFEIVSTQATISATPAQTANNLVGTFTKQEIKSGLTDIYYLNSDAFHQATSSLIVPAFRAYIKFAPSPSPTPERPDVFNIVIEGESTRLDQLREDISEEMIFDLNGIRQARLMPGMNIVKMKDGRTIKVYVNK